jgi:hypothetical protein
LRLAHGRLPLRDLVLRAFDRALCIAAVLKQRPLRIQKTGKFRLRLVDCALVRRSLLPRSFDLSSCNLLFAPKVSLLPGTVLLRFARQRLLRGQKFRLCSG